MAKSPVPTHHLAALTVQQAADLLGIQRPTLYPFIHSGELRSYRVGRRRLIRREALDQFQREREERHHAILTSDPLMRLHEGQ